MKMPHGQRFEHSHRALLALGGVVVAAMLAAITLTDGSAGSKLDQAFSEPRSNTDLLRWCGHTPAVFSVQNGVARQVVGATAGEYCDGPLLTAFRAEGDPVVGAMHEHPTRLFSRRCGGFEVLETPFGRVGFRTATDLEPAIIESAVQLDDELYLEVAPCGGSRCLVVLDVASRHASTIGCDLRIDLDGATLDECSQRMPLTGLQGLVWDGTSVFARTDLGQRLLVFEQGQDRCTRLVADTLDRRYPHPPGLIVGVTNDVVVTARVERGALVGSLVGEDGEAISLQLPADSVDTVVISNQAGLLIQTEDGPFWRSH